MSEEYIKSFEGQIKKLRFNKNNNSLELTTDGINWQAASNNRAFANHELRIKELEEAVEYGEDIQPVGLPKGGTSGQILVKKDNTDYNSEWINDKNMSFIGIFESKEKLDSNNKTVKDGDMACIITYESGIKALPNEITPYAPNYLRIMYVNGPKYNSSMVIGVKVNNDSVNIHEKYSYGTTGIGLIINQSTINFQNSSYIIEVLIQDNGDKYVSKLNVSNGIWDGLTDGIEIGVKANMSLLIYINNKWQEVK